MNDFKIGDKIIFGSVKGEIVYISDTTIIIIYVQHNIKLERYIDKNNRFLLLDKEYYRNEKLIKLGI